MPPTTIENITGAAIETKINATDSEDALRYLPSLPVRRRDIGQLNHAVLSSRASGTGNHFHPNPQRTYSAELRFDL
jgi:iron complex outermembrane recepter protein